MEPYDINSGRFYLRAVHDQTTINDDLTLAEIPGNPPLRTKAEAERGWMSDSCYSWAVCEQTSEEMLALVTFDPASRETQAFPVGDPDTVWDHNRELQPVTLGEAAAAGERAVRSHT